MYIPVYNNKYGVFAREGGGIPVDNVHVVVKFLAHLSRRLK